MDEHLNLFSQLSDGEQRDFVKRLAAAEYASLHGIASRPEPKGLGMFVRFQRHMWGWKKETLASLACVSLSTIERIERGERVRDECLERVALALGYKRGDFTKPRVPLAGDEAVAFLDYCLKPFEEHRWIDVEPVRKHRQIVTFAKCHLCQISSERLSVDVSDGVTALWEEIDFVAFVRDDTFKAPREPGERRIQRRPLYNMILEHIGEIERAAHAVALGGTYEATTDHPLLPHVRVAVIAFFPRATDPGAIKRRHLLVPERVNLLRRSGA